MLKELAKAEFRLKRVAVLGESIIHKHECTLIIGTWHTVTEVYGES